MNKKLFETLKSKHHKEESYFTQHNSFIDKNYLNISYPSINKIPDNRNSKLNELNKLSDELIDMILLKMEIRSKNNTCELQKNATSTEVINKTIEIIHKYQWKIGGYYIDSWNWNICNNTKILLGSLTNTINTYDSENDEVSDFFDLLINKLNDTMNNYEFEWYLYAHTRSHDKIHINIKRK